ncbi:efflux pump antibiotic resistance protein, putative [Talaromyces stipitatus ATCC 10500]|uniref:Efflux pump antibiotic resistance protein, putative n=1 Tax=Talaromyces stipitatus (strain ATCC 10500 / CBS 375.48 / QM 6759 / NRRL 1006) TaxID=441959 RepID=B8MJ87_TALSN|nr:efflux pump antibiotic resistance protein, putative [Talaromyces stipitatus ATCC 10500]EED14676.1 efflux pump antibiotic resistance protein, putative [Talaromyces stipitatus ATCC 10500]
MEPNTDTSHTTDSSRTLPDIELAEHPITPGTVQSIPHNDVSTTQQFADHQSRALPHSRLMVVFPVLALAQFTAYLDQTSISTAVPAIGDALGLGASLPWVATAYLLATTAVQLANGRLSDIFGRKRLLITSLLILAVGNLVAGFSTSPGMLFAFRAVSGIGGGAITALVMIIASDVTTLQQRGKYNGFIGAAVACGSGMGPLIGGAITAHVSWRWTLWYDVPWLIFLIVLLYITLPGGPKGVNTQSKIKMIDWAGLFISIAAIVLLVIPLSRGGSTISWSSAQAIAMLVVGGFVILVFLAVEGKFASLPIMPLHLFTVDFSCNLLLIQNVLYGFVFWGNLFYMPIYLQNVRGYSSTLAGAIIMPMVGTQGIGSIISGLIISRTGHYNPVMITSQFIWMAGLIGQIFYSAASPIWVVCLVGFFQGLGTGGCFQPSLVAILAHSRRADRAVLNSLRNFLRTMGGTLGLTVSGTILNNVLQSRLNGVVSNDIASQLTSSAHSLDSLGLTVEQRTAVLDAYMHGIHLIFIVYAPLIGICGLCALLVRDQGLAEKDTSTTLQVRFEKKSNVTEASSASASVHAMEAIAGSK